MRRLRTPSKGSAKLGYGSCFMALFIFSPVSQTFPLVLVSNLSLVSKLAKLFPDRNLSRASYSTRQSDLGVKKPHVVMSATTTTLTTTTLVGTPSVMTTDATFNEEKCPTCGGNGDSHESLEAQQRIQELEGQIQDLMAQAVVTGKVEPCFRVNTGFLLATREI